MEDIRVTGVNDLLTTAPADMLNPNAGHSAFTVAFRLSEWPDEDWRKQFNIEAQRNAQMHAGHVSFIVLYPDSLLVCSVEDVSLADALRPRIVEIMERTNAAVRSIRKLAVTRDADVAAHKQRVVEAFWPLER